MDREKEAIELIKIAANMSQRYYDAPIICTYSGGKDSDVLLELFLRSGVEFEVHNSHTTADAPQTVYHIRNKFKQLEERGIKCTIQYPEMSMWQLIPFKRMPPTRRVRYCCEYLKETACTNRMIATGVRWDESNARKKRDVMEIITPHEANKIKLSNAELTGKSEENKQFSIFENEEDNEETMLMNDNKRRLVFERCQLKAKSVCNPIVDWTNRDIWEYINSEGIKVNELYQRGFTRVGCIGCPMAGKKRNFEFQVFPKYKQMYISAFQRMVDALREEKEIKWQSGEDVFSWWMQEDNIGGQMTLEDFIANFEK